MKWVPKVLNYIYIMRPNEIFTHHYFSDSSRYQPAEANWFCHCVIITFVPMMNSEYHAPHTASAYMIICCWWNDIVISSDEQLTLLCVYSRYIPSGVMQSASEERCVMEPWFNSKHKWFGEINNYHSSLSQHVHTFKVYITVDNTFSPDFVRTK